MVLSKRRINENLDRQANDGKKITKGMNDRNFKGKRNFSHECVQFGGSVGPWISSRQLYYIVPKLWKEFWR